MSPANAATLLRGGLGVMYLAHAWLKLGVFGMPAAAAWFAAQGLPGWLAYLVVGLEVPAGLMLLAGWQARRVALAMLPVLAGALWVHLGNGWVFSAPNGGWEYPAFLILASLVQAQLGDGRWSLAELARVPGLTAVSPAR